VVRRVDGAGREVDECRFFGRQRLLVLDPGARLLRHVGHEVVVRVVRQLDHGRAVIQKRRPLVGLAADEAVELVEALARRPTVERAGDARLPDRRLMPFAEGRGGIAVQAQHLGQRCGRAGNLASVAGHAGGHLGDVAHVHLVMVAPGVERRARRRTQRRGVEVVVAQALLGEAIERRHRDRPAEAARHAEAHVVDQHDHHVGRALRRLDLEARRHRHVTRVKLGVDGPRRLRDWQYGSVHRLGC
jgi:hypothetical protein